MEAAERTGWICEFRVDKYEGDWTPEQIHAGEADAALYDSIEGHGNLLLTGGASRLWQRLISDAATKFDNAAAHIGVGDSATAAAASQTDLVAASNKLRKAQDATYPQHTDSTSVVGAQTITYKSTFATGDANWVWNEWGLFDAASAGRMLNRKVEALGTKTSAATWVLTVTITLA